MGFRTDKELSAAICGFLGTAVHGRLKELWAADGPTQLACDYIDKGSPLSHGEHLILQVAFDLWNGHGKATLADLIGVLDDENLGAVLDVIKLARPGVRR